MSKVEELLETYNPNGVSSIKLGDILDYEQPSKYIVSSSEYDDKYDIPVLTAGQTFILGYTDEKDGVYKASKNNPTIIFDDFTTGHHWVDFDFKVKSSAMKMLRLKNDKSLLRYIFHSMALVNYVPTEHSRQWISKYSQFEISLPHVKVQEEIVKILDSFTNLIDALNEELSLRQKQLEYYREKLLTFDDKIEFDNIRLVHIDDICNVSRGASPRPIKNYLTQSEEGIPWIKIGDVTPFDKYIKRTNERITKEGAQKSRLLHKGDLILSNSLSFGRPYILEIDGCIHDGWISLSGFENYVLRDFLYEVLNTKSVQNYWTMKANNGGAMSNLNSDIVKSTIIKIPSIKVQEDIVKILDSFTNLISSLKEEIALRQKQYEYYREKLLTFD